MQRTMKVTARSWICWGVMLMTRGLPSSSLEDRVTWWKIGCNQGASARSEKTRENWLMRRGAGGALRGT